MEPKIKLDEAAFNRGVDEIMLFKPLRKVVNELLKRLFKLK